MDPRSKRCNPSWQDSDTCTGTALRLCRWRYVRWAQELPGIGRLAGCGHVEICRHINLWHAFKDEFLDAISISFERAGDTWIQTEFLPDARPQAAKAGSALLSLRASDLLPRLNLCQQGPARFSGSVHVSRDGIGPVVPEFSVRTWEAGFHSPKLLGATSPRTGAGTPSTDAAATVMFAAKNLRRVTMRNPSPNLYRK